MSDEPRPPEEPPAPEWVDDPAAPTVPMDDGDAAPETGASAAARSKLPLVIGSVVALVVLALAALVFVYLRGTPDRLATAVPADAQVYVTIHLDPGLQQKWQIRRLLDRFPDVEGKSPADLFVERFEQALEEGGADFERDIEPWLGSQIAFYVRDPQAISSPEFPGVILLHTKDPDRAVRFFRGFAPQGEQPLTWTTSEHHGVTIHHGTGGAQIVMAAVDDVLVLSPAADDVAEAIDAALGDRSLGDEEAYRDLVGALPSRRVATFFVEASPALFGAPTEDAEASQEDPVHIALSLSVPGDGVALDVAVELNEEGRKIAEGSVEGDPEDILAWFPADAFGFFSFAGVSQALQDFETGFDQARALVPELKPLDVILGQAGAPTVDEIVDMLGSSAGLEVSPGDERPDGALILEVRDRQAVHDALSDLFLAGGMSWEDEEYRGTTIQVLTGPDVDEGFSPAYAVTGEVAILTSTVEEMHRILDARSEGSVLDAAPYQRAGEHLTDEDLQGVIYLNVRAITDAIRDTMHPDVREDFDHDVLPNLRPVESVIMSFGDDGEHALFRLFVVIPED